MSAHNDGSIELLTGKTPDRARPDLDRPRRASRFRHGRQQGCAGSRADGLPQYVGIPRQPFMTRPMYLGLAHSAFATGDPADPKFRPPNLTLAAGVNAQSPRRRRGLLAAVRRLAPRSRSAPARSTASIISASRPSRCSRTPERGRASIPGQGRPSPARPLRPAPLGAELPAGPAAGRGRRRP